MVSSKFVTNSLKINRLYCSKTITTSVALKEERIRIRDVNVNYTKVGTGPRVVLCVPGGIGTMETDFKPQLEGFDRSKFTMVAYDPPGYERDAEFLYDFMKRLDIPRYSILGWSAGSAISMIHAAKYPQAVDKLVIFGAHSYVTGRELECWTTFNDLNKWSDQFAKTFIEVYGKETVQDLWKKLMDGIAFFYQSTGGNICRDLLKDIQCPTYILYGEKDILIEPDQVSYLKSHIKDSRVHLYPEGKHNIQLRYTEDFNKRVQDFLLQDSKKLN